MKKLTLALALLALATPAYAEVYTYGCHRPDDFKLYAAKLDFTKRTITWNGTVYQNMKRVMMEADGSDCAKACFRATSRKGIIVLSTATQGVASLTVVGNDSTGDEAECDLIR
jgi:hypothetical protein